MDIIKKWYADRLDKTPEEFDDVDNYIVIVLQTWEKERKLIKYNNPCLKCDNGIIWEEDGLSGRSCGCGYTKPSK